MNTILLLELKFGVKQMNKFTNQQAQGELLFIKIDKLPENLTEIKPEDNNYIVGHSETGHHHVVKYENNIKYYQAANDNNIAYLVVDNTKGVKVEHQRSFDTHKSLELVPGVYQIRKQQEFVDDLWQFVLD